MTTSIYSCRIVLVFFSFGILCIWIYFVFCCCCWYSLFFVEFHPCCARVVVQVVLLLFVFYDIWFFSQFKKMLNDFYVRCNKQDWDKWCYLLSFIWLSTWIELFHYTVVDLNRLERLIQCHWFLCLQSTSRNLEKVVILLKDYYHRLWGVLLPFSELREVEYMINTSSSSSCKE